MSERGSARRALASRTATALAGFCVLGGCLSLALAAYQLWGTSATERAAQSDLRAAFTAAEKAPVASSSLAPPSTTAPAVADRPVAESEGGAGEEPTVTLLPGGVDPALAARQFPADGDALARLQIPAIDLDKFVMRDVSVAALQVGPGHYEHSARPGYDGNAAIAGHRTTYGAPFGQIDELRAGDEITVQSADGTFTYAVLEPVVAFGERVLDVNEVHGGHVIVDPDDTWVVADFGDARLTLTSCHPEFTSRDRIVVVAELVSEGVAYGDIFGGLDERQLTQLVEEDLSSLGQS